MSFKEHYKQYLRNLSEDIVVVIAILTLISWVIASAIIYFTILALGMSPLLVVLYLSFTGKITIDQTITGLIIAAVFIVFGTYPLASYLLEKFEEW